MNTNRNSILRKQLASTIEEFEKIDNAAISNYERHIPEKRKKCPSLRSIKVASCRRVFTLKFGLFKKLKNLKKSSSWFGCLLNKCTKHDEFLSASQKVRTLWSNLKKIYLKRLQLK